MPDFNPWANSEKILSFTPPSSLSSIIHQHFILSNRGDPPFLSLSPLSTPMEI
jgi:hypothetical protein